MDAQELLDDLERAGARVAREGRNLQVTGLARVLTPAVRMEIKRLKPQLLALLGGGDDLAPVASSPPAAGLPVAIEDWPDYSARHGLAGARLEWPEGSPGLVAVLPAGGVFPGKHRDTGQGTWNAC